MEEDEDGAPELATDDLPELVTDDLSYFIPSGLTPYQEASSEPVSSIAGFSPFTHGVSTEEAWPQALEDEGPSQSTNQARATEIDINPRETSNERHLRSATDLDSTANERSRIQAWVDKSSPQPVAYETTTPEGSRERIAENEALSQLPSYKQVLYDESGRRVSEEPDPNADETRLFLGPNEGFGEYELCEQAFKEAIYIKFLHDTEITGSQASTLPQHLNAGLQRFLGHDPTITSIPVLFFSDAKDLIYSEVAGCRLAGWVGQQKDLPWHMEVFKWLFGKTVGEMLECQKDK